jgi:hypothetical protein
MSHTVWRRPQAAQPNAPGKLKGYLAVQEQPMLHCWTKTIFPPSSVERASVCFRQAATGRAVSPWEGDH